MRGMMPILIVVLKSQDCWNLDAVGMKKQTGEQMFFIFLMNIYLISKTGVSSQPLIFFQCHMSFG